MYHTNLPHILYRQSRGKKDTLQQLYPLSFNKHPVSLNPSFLCEFKNFRFHCLKLLLSYHICQPNYIHQTAKFKSSFKNVDRNSA